MAHKSDYLENKLIDWFWRGQAFTPPVTLYFALFTASTGTGGNTSNNNAITFPAPSANWGVVTSVGVFDAATARCICRN